LRAGADSQPELFAPEVSFNLAAWLKRALWLDAHERSAADHFDAVEAHGLVLTIALVRSCRDADALRQLVRFLGPVRSRYGEFGRYFGRRRAGEIMGEAKNRVEQLAKGRTDPRVRGPRLDPTRLPDEALDRLIQSHKDLRVVEALRNERERRAQQTA